MRDRIFPAHSFSSAALALFGWQTKMAWRLGVSLAMPAGLYGPPIWTAPTLAKSM